MTLPGVIWSNAVAGSSFNPNAGPWPNMLSFPAHSGLSYPVIFIGFAAEEMATRGQSGPLLDATLTFADTTTLTISGADSAAPGVTSSGTFNTNFAAFMWGAIDTRIAQGGTISLSIGTAGSSNGHISAYAIGAVICDGYWNSGSLVQPTGMTQGFPNAPVSAWPSGTTDRNPVGMLECLFGIGVARLVAAQGAMTYTLPDANWENEQSVNAFGLSTDFFNAQTQSWLAAFTYICESPTTHAVITGPSSSSAHFAWGAFVTSGTYVIPGTGGQRGGWAAVIG